MPPPLTEIATVKASKRGRVKNYSENREPESPDFSANNGEGKRDFWPANQRNLAPTRKPESATVFSCTFFPLSPNIKKEKEKLKNRSSWFMDSQSEPSDHIPLIYRRSTKQSRSWCRRLKIKKITPTFSSICWFAPFAIFNFSASGFSASTA